MKRFLIASMLLLTSAVHAEVAAFLGLEYQGQNGSGAPAGTIRGGNPAQDAAFSDWLATAGLTTADLSTSLGAGDRAVWGILDTDAGSGATSYSYAIGGNTVSASVVGWSNTTNSVTSPGSATISTAGLNGTTLQSGSPRPGFASGTGSGYYLYTVGGSSSDNVRNAINIDLSGFAGGGVYSYGMFVGDVETGGPGSVLAFLRLTFLDDSFYDITLTPDATLFPNALWSGNNNVSETYGNETTRFIGFVSDTMMVKSALLVVGDDDLNENGDSEQVSIIAQGITFLDSSGNPVAPTNVPEPGGVLLLFTTLGTWVLRRRRRA